MLRFTLKSIILLFLLNTISYSQVEHVPVTHPVYKFLEHAETKGFFKHFSLSDIPLQRIQVVNSLKEIRKNSSRLNNSEMEVLEGYETEFEV